MLNIITLQFTISQYFTYIYLIIEIIIIFATEVFQRSRKIMAKESLLNFIDENTVCISTFTLLYAQVAINKNRRKFMFDHQRMYCRIQAILKFPSIHSYFLTYII